jgi:nicotinamidase-related amidase
MASFPSFYRPERIGTLFYPEVQAIAAEAEQAGLRPATDDNTRVDLLIIDMQVDFCHERGALHVPGAREDIRRTIEFLYRNAERITHITCTLDSHVPFQIFHPAWWADAEGRHPAPFTIITADDVNRGVWLPLREAEWSREYVQRLQREAKKQLTIWPYHAIQGGVGHAMDPELWSAVLWHAIARGSQPTWWTKGSIPRTEHYSILRPEIHVPGHPQGGLSSDFVDVMDEYDYVLVAGEAESHCVLETVKDLVDVFQHTPEKLEKVYILRDCTSPVRHPRIDFHALAQTQFAEYARKGARFIQSTDPLPF